MNKRNDAEIERFCRLVESGDLKGAIDLIVDYDKANPNCRFVEMPFVIYGMNALAFAAGEGAVEVLDSLVEQSKKYRLNISAPLSSALLRAVNAEVVVALVAAGADVNARGGMARTALHAAVMKERTGVVEALVGCGADIEAKDEWGRTAAMWAARMWHADALRFLAGKGADLNALDHEKNDALSLTLLAPTNEEADLQKAFDCVAVILKSGIPPNRPLPNGELPSTMARRHGLHSVIGLLQASALTGKHCPPAAAGQTIRNLPKPRVNAM